MKDFRIKTAIVTRASSGLGCSFAFHLFAADTRLVLGEIYMWEFAEASALSCHICGADLK